jgi:hypothetical protein
MPVFGQDLAREVGRRYGAPVEMMQLKHGIFDEASISVIASATVWEIGRLAGRSLEARQFRPNIVVRLTRPVPFQEDQWLGGTLSFGEGDDAPLITVTMRDLRCGHSHGSTGNRTEHKAPCGDQQKGTRVIKLQCLVTEPRRRT